MASDELKTLTLSEIRQVYNQRMTRDFPRNERKSLRQIEKMLQKGGYLCYGLMNEGFLAAYAFLVALEGGGYLLDYIAVDEKQRGAGLGSRFLRLLSEGPLRDARCIILEVEDPQTARDEKDIEKRWRRLRFYQKAGMVDTGVRARTFGVDYLILRFPQGDTKANIRGVYRAAYRAFVPWFLYIVMVRVK